ncbi:MAG: EamA family transporter [Candidatus Kuenenia sp.]|nr:EamA family transporter [Candidatus Kuenenia hertensis]
MIKTFVFLFFMLTAQAFGHAFLSKGMVGIGELTAYGIREILFYALVVMRNPWIVFGIVFHAIGFFSWMYILSFSKLSMVLPLTSICYIMTAFLSKFMLGEQISPLRWAGTAVIVLGVYLITQG